MELGGAGDAAIPIGQTLEQILGDAIVIHPQVANGVFGGFRQGVAQNAAQTVKESQPLLLLGRQGVVILRNRPPSG